MAQHEMSRYHRVLTGLFIAVFALAATLVNAGPAAADNSVIEGVVVNEQSQPLDGVVVTVMHYGITAATDSQGTFSIEVPSGTYDLNFQPAEGSGLRSYLATGIDAGAGTPLTVVLKPVRVVRVEGILQDAKGRMTPANQVVFIPQSGGPATTVGVVNGRYSAELLAGVYSQIAVKSTAPYYQTYIGGQDGSPLIQFENDQTYDIIVPVADLNLSVRDAAGNSVSGARVNWPATNASFEYGGLSYAHYLDNGSFAFDNNGDITLRLVPQMTLTGASIVLASGLTLPVDAPLMTGDQTVTVTVPPSVHIEGALKDDKGRVTPANQLTFVPKSGGPATTVGVVNGRFAVDLLAGEYSQIAVRSTAPYYQTFIGRPDGSALVDFQTDQTYDVTVPVADLKVTIRDADGAVVPGARFNWPFSQATVERDGVSFAHYLDNGSYSMSDQGEVTLALVPGMTLAGASVVLASGLTLPVDAPLMTGDQTVTVTVPPSVHIEGALKDDKGRVTPANQLTFVPKSGPATTVGVVNGRFAVDLLAGEYSQIAVRSTAPYYQTFIGRPDGTALVDFQTDQTYDIVVPVADLKVTIRDADGAVVPGARFNWPFSQATVERDGVSFAHYLDNGSYSMDDGTVQLGLVPGMELNGATVVLPSGLTIPLDSPVMGPDRHLYIIFDRITGTFVIDSEPPVVTAVPDRLPNDANWYNGPLTVAWSSVDPTPSSGLVNVPESTVVTTEGVGQRIVSEQSCDRANLCSVGELIVNLDSTSPDVAVEGAVDGGTYVLGSVPLVTCSASDSLSGVAEPPMLSVTGGNADGSGTFTATCSGARDVAGNISTPASITYSVRYAVAGGGIGGGGAGGPVDAAPAINTGKAGRVYSVQWQLATSNGTPITSLSSVMSVTYKPVSCTTFAGLADALEAESSGNSGLEMSGQTYKYNWATPRTSGCYVLSVNLADGNALHANFDLV
jgi:hypothetical protein